jgi:hypothetical protein
MGITSHPNWSEVGESIDGCISSHPTLVRDGGVSYSIHFRHRATRKSVGNIRSISLRARFRNQNKIGSSISDVFFLPPLSFFRMQSAEHGDFSQPASSPVPLSLMMRVPSFFRVIFSHRGPAAQSCPPSHLPRTCMRARRAAAPAQCWPPRSRRACRLARPCLTTRSGVLRCVAVVRENALNPSK